MRDKMVVLLLCALLGGGCAAGREQHIAPPDAEGVSGGPHRAGQKRDRILAQIEKSGGGAGSIRKVVDMSDDWWVDGEENRTHGLILLDLSSRYPRDFAQSMEKSRARGSAEVLMDAARRGAEFSFLPDAIVLHGSPGQRGGSFSLDLGL